MAQGDLAGALKSFNEAPPSGRGWQLQIASNGGAQHDLAAVYSRLGDVKTASGETAAALQSYRAGLDILEALTKSDPSNAVWQRDLSIADERIGSMQIELGDLSGALKSFSDCLAIRRAARGSGSRQCDLAAGPRGRGP